MRSVRERFLRSIRMLLAFAHALVTCVDLWEMHREKCSSLRSMRVKFVVFEANSVVVSGARVVAFGSHLCLYSSCAC